MIKIENTEILGWKTLIRKMENFRLNSSESDSWYGCTKGDYGRTEYDYCNKHCIADCRYHLGAKDLKLLKLLKKDNDNGLLKTINIFCDITAPLYWWNELGTYVPNPTSNNVDMLNKICDKEFTLDDFSHEHLKARSRSVLQRVVLELNLWRNIYINGYPAEIGYAAINPKDKNSQYQIIQLLPNSYNQKRKIQIDYATLLRIYEFCKNRKLDEWRNFCNWILSLPYFKEICLED